MMVLIRFILIYVYSDLPGFTPLREDFDVEHENDAECLLAGLLNKHIVLCCQ